MEARKTREYIAWSMWQEVRHETRHGKKHGKTRGMVKDVAMVMVHNIKEVSKSYF